MIIVFLVLFETKAFLSIKWLKLIYLMLCIYFFIYGLLDRIICILCFKISLFGNSCSLNHRIISYELYISDDLHQRQSNIISFFFSINMHQYLKLLLINILNFLIKALNEAYALMLLYHRSLTVCFYNVLELFM